MYLDLPFAEWLVELYGYSERKSAISDDRTSIAFSIVLPEQKEEMSYIT